LRIRLYSKPPQEIDTKEITMSSVIHASSANFSREVLQSNVPVLVDFYADWCGPCRMLAPTLSRLATEFAGKVKIVKVNVDEEPDLASQFQVESIPTLAFVAAGKVIGRTSGLVPEAGLRQALNQLAESLSGPARRVG
jgi:thioredoxin 1